MLTLAALFSSTSLLAAGENRSKTLRVVTLSIVKPLADEDSELIFWGRRAGTAIELIVSQPGKRLLALDERASQLTRFTDDKKTDLSKTERDGCFEDFNRRVSPDGTRLGFGIRTTVVPAAGATRLLLKGKLVLLIGTQEKTAEVKKVALEGGGSVKVGPCEVRKDKTRSGEGSLVEVKHSEPNLKSITFLDKDGKVLPSEWAAGSFVRNGQTTYTVEYRVKGKIENGTVRVTYFSKVERVTVPLDLDIGVGF
jgi:hypothetical protein